MEKTGLVVDIKEMPETTKKFGAVAVVVAEWFPTCHEDEYSCHTAAITNKILDQIKRDARKRALRNGEDLQAVERQMCRDFQDALVDNVISVLLERKHDQARLEQHWGSEFD